jgi:HlyD family type I secretion membrane fusion protein
MGSCSAPAFYSSSERKPSRAARSPKDAASSLHRASAVQRSERAWPGYAISTNAKLRELQERLEPSLDQVDRQTVRSPADGEIMSLHVSGVGAVIGPREPLMDVVPSQERLVIEAHVRPQDINSVRRGAAAQVRLTSFDARTTPLLTGKVTIVSGDRVSVPDARESFFVAIAEVDAATLKSHPEIHLQPGMPAELYIAAGKRTLLEYLLRPVRVFAAHAMREP